VPFGWGNSSFGNSAIQRAVVGSVMDAVAENVGFSPSQASQLQQWFPNIVSTLRSYFAISHEYVSRKLLFLMFPFVTLVRHQSSWNGSSDSAGSGGGIFSSSDSTDKHKLNNIYCPDLYIPLMAFVTYILTCGLTRGTLDNFHPEVLSSTATYALVLVALEVLATKAGFYLSNYQGKGVKVLDIIAISGYKFVSLVVIVACGLLTGGTETLYWASFAYSAICASIATRLSLKFAVSERTTTASSQWNGSARNPTSLYLAWIVACAQMPMCWLLTPSWESKVRQSGGGGTIG